MSDFPSEVLFEVNFNWLLLNNPPLPEPALYYPQYFDPTRMIFKFRDDAITRYLLENCSMMLITLSNNIRLVNLQIDELLAFRFGDPAMFAKALAYFRSHQDMLYTPWKIHRKYRDWFEALAQRHWAIVNEGFWKRLKPSLEAVRGWEGKI